MELTRAPEYCSFKACKISRKGGFKQVGALPRKLLRDLNSTSAFNSPHHIYGVTGLWGDRKLHTMNLFFLLNNLLKFWIVKNAAPQAPGCYLIQAQHPLQTFKVNLRLEKNLRRRESSSVIKIVNVCTVGRTNWQMHTCIYEKHISQYLCMRGSQRPQIYSQALNTQKKFLSHLKLSLTDLHPEVWAIDSASYSVMYPLPFHHWPGTTKHTVQVLPGAGRSHPAAALSLSKSHLYFRGEKILMPVQDDACGHLETCLREN